MELWSRMQYRVWTTPTKSVDWSRDVRPVGSWRLLSKILGELGMRDDQTLAQGSSVTFVHCSVKNRPKDSSGEKTVRENSNCFAQTCKVTRHKLRYI